MSRRSWLLISIIIKYLPTGALMAGVKAGQLHQGHFNASQFNYLEVSVMHIHS